MRHSFIPAAAIVLTLACARTPRIDPSETQATFDDARSLLDLYPSRSTIDEAFWPDGLKALHPKAVRSGVEGLWVVTWSRGVEESGVFVPRDPLRFAPPPGGDPEFTLVSNAVYV